MGVGKIISTRGVLDQFQSRRDKRCEIFLVFRRETGVRQNCRGGNQAVKSRAAPPSGLVEKLRGKYGRRLFKGNHASGNHRLHQRDVIRAHRAAKNSVQASELAASGSPAASH